MGSVKEEGRSGRERVASWGLDALLWKQHYMACDSAFTRVTRRGLYKGPEAGKALNRRVRRPHGWPRGRGG